MDKSAIAHYSTLVNGLTSSLRLQSKFQNHFHKFVYRPGGRSYEYPHFAKPQTLCAIINRHFTMTEADKKLLFELDYGRVPFDNFLKQFSVDLKSDNSFIRTEMEAAIQSADQIEYR